MTLARLEVDVLRPRRTTVTYFETDVPPAMAELLRPVVEAAEAEVSRRLNISGSDARLLLAGEVARLAADGEAYARECARRGVLAL